jgi:hypothetical protein
MRGEKAEEISYRLQDPCLVDFSRQHGKEDQSP